MGRVTAFVFPADDVDKVVAHLDGAVDAFLRQPGLAHIEVFLDRRSGAALTVSSWESEEAMKASEDEADRLRNESPWKSWGGSRTSASTSSYAPSIPDRRPA